MTIAFATDPIKGFCNVQAPADALVPQCLGPDLYVMTDGFNQVGVCKLHRSTLLQHNQIWKTMWRDLLPGEQKRTGQERKGRPITDAYRAQPFSSHERGYPIRFFYSLSSGEGEGSYRIATFVTELEAKHFATHCNHQLAKYNTNDMKKWK